MSRQTVRAALTKLQQEGLITRGRGSRGRQVRDRRPLWWKLSEFERGSRRDDGEKGHDDWAAGVTDQGREPRQVVSVSIEAAVPEISAALELSDGSLVVRRQRVRYVDGLPFQLSTSWFPEDIARDTPLMEKRDVAVAGGILRSIGHPQIWGRDVITVRMPTPAEANQLDLPMGTPVGQHSRTGYGEDGAPVRHMITVFPGDRHCLVYELELS
ncbi:GntR family transcriptional regulator [Streptomonospora salina]|uniref:GntR family transcriptional regulator n=1 Tax=Streptomonospora salina TaxID=104205 RepID=A0A841EKN5_9ACTN|nr:GntR family transcriptional regulator [Streptomonospora salina]